MGKNEKKLYINKGCPKDPELIMKNNLKIKLGK
jgi:hypothetical protein